jgi:hypothetical protein
MGIRHLSFIEDLAAPEGTADSNEYKEAGYTPSRDCSLREAVCELKFVTYHASVSQSKFRFARKRRW